MFLESLSEEVETTSRRSMWRCLRHRFKKWVLQKWTQRLPSCYRALWKHNKGHRDFGKMTANQRGKLLQEWFDVVGAPSVWSTTFLHLHRDEENP